MRDVKWSSKWRPALTVNSTIGTLFLGLGSLAAVTSGAPEEPAWSATSFDESVREFFVAKDFQSHRRIALTSDVLLGVLQLWPVLLDGVLVAHGIAKNPKLMLQMLAINLQAFAVSNFLNVLAKFAMARERPYAKHGTCPEGECGDPTLSFFSGHTAGAFTAASLMCTHRRQMRIYGTAGDPLACGAAVAMATTIGVMRMAADKHWVTDVMMGVVVGILSGWVLPRFVYYRMKPGTPLVAPFATQSSAGLMVSGTL